MRWMTGGDTSIHIEMGVDWKVGTLIIPAQQFMASNCVFTVHRARPRRSWRDSSSGFWKRRKTGRVDTRERWDLSRRKTCSCVSSCNNYLVRNAISLLAPPSYYRQGIKAIGWYCLAVQQSSIVLIKQPSSSFLFLAALCFYIGANESRFLKQERQLFWALRVPRNMTKRAQLAHCARIKPSSPRTPSADTSKALRRGLISPSGSLWALLRRDWQEAICADIRSSRRKRRWPEY